LEFLEALACGFEHRVVVAVRDSEFRRQKYLLAIDGGLRDGRTDLAFVAVHLGGVDMAIADIECGRHGTPTGRPARAPRAEAECRDLGIPNGDVLHILKSVGGRIIPLIRRKGYTHRARRSGVLDIYPDLDPAENEVLTAELHATDDVLVKAFALGPGASIDAHTHDGATNVFHVLDGRIVVTRDDEEETVTAPGVVPNERGAVHGARNESDEPAVLTAKIGR